MIDAVRVKIGDENYMRIKNGPPHEGIDILDDIKDKINDWEYKVICDDLMKRHNVSNRRQIAPEQMRNLLFFMAMNTQVLPDWYKRIETFYSNKIHFKCMVFYLPFIAYNIFIDSECVITRYISIICIVQYQLFIGPIWIVMNAYKHMMKWREYWRLIALMES